MLHIVRGGGGGGRREGALRKSMAIRIFPCV